MVLHVVSLPDIPEICFYDDVKNIYEKLPFDLTLLPWEIDKVDEYLKKICNVFNRPIDNYYIILDWSYLNDIRKTIIEASKKYYIKNSRIISIFSAAAVIASTCISTDSLWVFFCVPLHYCCMLWEKGKNEKLEFKNFIFRTLNNENIDRSTEELSIFKKHMNNFNDGLSASFPLVVLHKSARLKKENFFTIFHGQKDIIFKTLENGFAHEFLQCIQHFYKLNQVFGKLVEIKDSDYLASFYYDYSVPFDYEIEVNYRKRNTVLKVMEGNDFITKKITFNKAGKWIININVDSNGIYTITTKEKRTSKNMLLPILTFSTNKSETSNVFELFPKLEEYDASINAVGIDFGTSECCAFVIRKHGPDGVVLDPITKLRTLSTYTTIDCKRLCGQIVFDRIEYNVQQTAFNIKRLLGKNVEEIVMDPLWSFNIINYYNQIALFGGSVGKNTYYSSSVEICSTVLCDIKSKIDEYQGCLLEDVVITIPSCYDERQKDATVDAAEIAEWKHVNLLSEPIAAAFAYSYEKEFPKNSMILLFDCGGGTTDICIGKVHNEKLQILCENGDFFIGGNDFDKILIDYFNEILKEKYNFDALNSTKKYRLMRKCREIKHFLSAHETDKLDVDDFIFDHDDVGTG